MKLYVGSLSFHMTEGELRAVFEAYGDVESVRIVTDQETGRSRGFGFVEMPDVRQAKDAIEALNGRRFELLSGFTPFMVVNESTGVDNERTFDFIKKILNVVEYFSNKPEGSLVIDKINIDLIDFNFELFEFESGVQLVSNDPDVLKEDLRIMVTLKESYESLSVTLYQSSWIDREENNEVPIRYLIDVLNKSGMEICSIPGKINRGVLYDPRSWGEEEVVEF